MVKVIMSNNGSDDSVALIMDILQDTIYIPALQINFVCTHDFIFISNQLTGSTRIHCFDSISTMI